MRAQHLHHRVALGRSHLQQHAQLFGEQRTQRQLFAPRADLLRPVLGVAVFGAAVADAVALGHQQIDVERHADLAGKGHLGRRGQQAAVAAVVVGEDLAVGAQLVDGGDQLLQQLGLVQIGHAVLLRAAALAQRLREHAAGQAMSALAQIDQQQRRVLLAVQLRRERAAHVLNRGKGADDQADGRDDFLGRPLRLPLRAHRQAVFTDGNRHAQGRAQLHADGLDGGVQRRVFTRLAAGGHPVGGQLDARQFNRRREQIGDRLGHGHAARCGRIQRGQRRAFAHAHRFAGEALEIGQRHGAVGHRNLPRPDHLVAVREAAHGAVANGDEKALAGDGGVAQYLDDGVLQGHPIQVERREFARQGGYVAVHLGRLAEQHVHGHVDGLAPSPAGGGLGWGQAQCAGDGAAPIPTFPQRGKGQIQVADDELPLLRRYPHHRKRAPLPRTQRLKQRQRFRRNRHHIAFLAFVAPDFLRRQAAFFQRHGAQIKARTATCIVRQFRKSIRQATRPHVVNRQDRVIRAQRLALRDDLLRAAFDLRVAALYRIKIQVRRVGPAGQRRRRAAAHADAHAGTAHLNQQATGRKLDLVRQARVDAANATRDHDRLVIAALHAAGLQLVFAEVTQQIRPPEFVVESRAAQRPLGHDLQRAGHVLGLADRRIPQLADSEPCQPGLGPRAAPGRAFIANLAARAGAGAGEGADRRRVVVRFHLHQHVARGSIFLIAACARPARASGRFGLKNLDRAAFHHRRVVAVGDHGVLRVLLLGVADHAEKALVLRHAVDGELRVENLVAAMLAVGLREHHQLHIGRVAAQLREGVHQIVDLVSRQRQTPVGVGLLQRGAATGQHIDVRQRLRMQLGEQRARLVAAGQHALGHAVVQQRGDGIQITF